MNKPIKEKAPTIKDVLVAINSLTEVVTKLVDKPIVTPVVARVSVPITPEPPSQFPIPLEYTDIVNTILNKKFGIDIKYQSDNAAFEFHILVPQEYSNAGAPHWETYHEDRRSKVILNALGSNGVREWATKVYENFNPEMKSKITYDRGQI